MVDLLAPEYTYESILSDMLSRIPDNIDKREGSIIYDAMAPAALKLAEAYFIMFSERDLYFLDTTEGEYLDRRAIEYGLERKQATYALREGTFTDKDSSPIDVPLGERFRISDVSFVVESKVNTGVFRLRCEQLGSIGNSYSGIMLPLGNDVPFVANAILGDILIHGEDTEDDGSLRSRVLDNIINTECDGNVAQYIKWASQFEGIGVTKVFPLALGNNTVKVSITNSKNQVATSELIKSFQDYLDPGSKGLGNGKAPIGAKITVTTGIVKTINVKADVTLAQGELQVTGAQEAVEAYLSSITYKESRVSFIGLASVILGLPSVSDVRNMTLNGTTSDIALGDEDIPTLGTLELVVV